MQPRDFEDKRSTHATGWAGSTTSKSDAALEEQDWRSVQVPSTPYGKEIEFERSQGLARGDAPLLAGEDANSTASPIFPTPDSSHHHRLSPCPQLHIHPHQENANYEAASMSSFHLSYPNSPSLTFNRYPEHPVSPVLPFNHYQYNPTHYKQLNTYLSSSDPPMDENPGHEPLVEPELEYLAPMPVASDHNISTLFAVGPPDESAIEPFLLDPLLDNAQQEIGNERPSPARLQLISSASPYRSQAEHLSASLILDPMGDASPMSPGHLAHVDNGFLHPHSQYNEQHSEQADADGESSAPIPRAEDAEFVPPTPQRTSARSTSSNTSRVDCPDCEGSFARKNLSKHRRTHEEGRFLCYFPDCGSRHKFPRDLQRHTDTVHLKKRSHQCNVCGRAFGRSDHLVRHWRVHET